MIHMKVCVPTFFIISRSFLLITRNISDKVCRENRNTHLKLNNFLFDNRAVYKAE
jgi:hypothetical protein